MAETGDVITNPVAKMRMVVLQTSASTSGELFEVEATYESSSVEPIPHLHPAQDEHFEILRGSMRVRIEGDERDLAAGETLDVPRETVHSMWNNGSEPAVVLWQTRPALRTESFFEAVADLMSKEDADPSDGAKLVSEYADVFRPVLPGSAD